MKKLSTIFIFTILTCLVISITLTSLVTSSTSKDAIEYESQNLLKSLALQSSEQMNQKIEGIENKLNFLSTIIANDFKYHNIDSLLEEYNIITANLNINNKDAFASYIVFNPDYFPVDGVNFPYQILYTKDVSGNAIAMNDLADINDFESAEDYMAWFHAPINAKSGVWSDIYYDEFIKTRLITYSTPILYNGQAIGVIGIDIKFDDFERIIEEIKVYDTGYAFLMNDDYDYLVHPTLKPEENIRNIESGKYAYMADIFDANDTGIIEYYFNKTDKLMAYAHLSNGWVIAVAPSYKEVYAVYDSLSSKRIYVIGFGFLFSFFIALVVGKRISKPLTLLTEDINIMTKQELEKDLPERSHTEIYEVSILYDSFMNLRQHLLEAFTEIREHNISLEQLVKSRTKELLESNQELNTSLLELKHMQNQIVEVKKQEEINSLIKNITHSINTPLGNAITTHSYIEANIKKYSSDNHANLPLYHSIEQALSIVKNSYDNMRHIIDGLSILTNDFGLSSIIQTPLKTLIQSRYLWTKSNNADVDMSLILECNDETIACNQNMLLKLFTGLLDLSVHLHSLESGNSLQIHISVQKDGDCFMIHYFDSINSTKKIYEYSNNINTGKSLFSNFTLDINIINAIIQNGLDGQSEFKISEEGLCKWIIRLKNK